MEKEIWRGAVTGPGSCNDRTQNKLSGPRFVHVSLGFSECNTLSHEHIPSHIFEGIMKNHLTTIPHLKILWILQRVHGYETGHKKRTVLSRDWCWKGCFYTNERLHAPCRRSQVSVIALSATDNHLELYHSILIRFQFTSSKAISLPEDCFSFKKKLLLILKVLGLQNNCEESLTPYIPHPVSLIINLLQLHGIFITIKKPVLRYQSLCFTQIPLVLTSGPFEVQDPSQAAALRLVVKSPSLLLIFSQTFPVFWWPWPFSGVLVRYSMDGPSAGVCLLFFSWLDWGYGLWGVWATNVTFWKNKQTKKLTIGIF